MKLLELQNIKKNYNSINGEINALENINFTINKNEFIAIVGPSGCGKTTILEIICNLEKETSGNILKFKKNLSFGYMFQTDTLFNWLTVLENCLLPLKINKTNTILNKNRILKLLEKYGLKDFLNKYPKELSGGMKQRVSLIRALGSNPDILLLDEPFSKLDYQTKLIVSNDVFKIIKEEGKTIVLVTHDIEEAISMANKIIVLSKRPSKIKSIHKIKFKEKSTPLENRKKEKFKKYYEDIWKELDINVL